MSAKERPFSNKKIRRAIKPVSMANNEKRAPHLIFMSRTWRTKEKEKLKTLKSTVGMIRRGDAPPMHVELARMRND